MEVANQDPNQSPENVSMLTQAIRDRDEQIEQLQDKLSEASRYILTTYTLPKIPKVVTLPIAKIFIVKMRGHSSQWFHIWKNELKLKY